MAASPRLFIVGTRYAIPDYQLRLPNGAYPIFQHPSGVRVQHPSGVRVQVGQTPTDRRLARPRASRTLTSIPGCG